MATYDWPTAPAYCPQSMTLRQLNNTRSTTSPLSGYTQTVGIPGTRWGAVMSFPPGRFEGRRLLEAFLLRLEGQRHRVRLWDMGYRNGVPLGTINQSGGAVAQTAAQFSNSVQLSGCGSGATLLAGDRFAVSGMLLAVVEDALADGAGGMTVAVSPMLRKPAIVGAPVTLVRPMAEFVLDDATLAFMRSPGSIGEGFEVGFTEVWS